LFVGFVVTAAVVITAVYLPFYNMYLEGCVIPHEAIGTPFADNIYAVAYNFASHDGDMDRVSGEEEYEARKAEICAEWQDSSTKEQQRMSIELEMTKSSLKNVKEQVDLPKKCLAIGDYDQYWGCDKGACDWRNPTDPHEPPCDTYDEDNENENITRPLACAKYLHCDKTALCPTNTAVQPAVPFRSLSNTVLRSPCIGEFAVDGTKIKDLQAMLNAMDLEDAVFQCTALPTCEVQCDGTDKRALRQYSIVSGCTMEYFMHAGGLAATFSVIIYVVLNISRILFINGVNRITWKELYTGHFSYIAACDMEGHTQYKKTDLRKRLHTTLRWFKWKGVFMVVLAALINIPWMVGIAYAVDQLPHAGEQFD